MCGGGGCPLLCQEIPVHIDSCISQKHMLKVRLSWDNTVTVIMDGPTTQSKDDAPAFKKNTNSFL